MTTPRTLAARALLSGMRPHVKRGVAATILAIEAQAVAPYVDVLGEIDQTLEYLATRDATADWDGVARAGYVARAEAARQLVAPLLAPPGGAEQGRTSANGATDPTPG